MARKPKLPDNARIVKEAANGRWAEILSAICGISLDLLDGKAHACPKCGGKDRFRFSNMDGDGSIICNQCAKRICGDGLETAKWATGWTFLEALRRVADHLGIDVSSGKRVNRKGQVNPAKDLSPTSWSDLIAGGWCIRKPPITVAGLKAAGARMAFYRKRYRVIDLGIVDDTGDVVGHCIYNAAGGTLPKFTQRSDGGWDVEQVKIKLTAGSNRPGWIGTVDRLANATTVWKVEGPSDVLTACSWPDLPQDVAIITNPCGAGERPTPAMLQQLAGKTVNVVGDADHPGHAGNEIAWTAWCTDRKTPEAGSIGWAHAIAGFAAEVRHVILPYEIVAVHGKDIRDWAQEGNTYADILGLAAESPVIIKPSNEPTIRPIEALDDPSRLARVNIEKYRASGRNLVFYSGKWLAWKRGCYRVVEDRNLRAKLAGSIKQEFDRAYLAGEQEGTGPVKQVSHGLVCNVMLQTESLVSLPTSADHPSWLTSDQPFPANEAIATTSGILHLPSLANGEMKLMDPTPDFFSMNCLPYPFDPDAKCPVWEETLRKFWQDDNESILALQEWFGYCLLPDTKFHKLLMLVGPTRSGKGTIGRVLQGLIGKQNMASPTLASMAGPFALEPLQGKMVGLIADARLSSRTDGIAVVERLLSISGDDPQDIARKNTSTVSGASLPIKFVVMTNELPNVHDSSGALMSRIIMLRMCRSFLGSEDRSLGSKLTAELPGILNWAIEGWQSLQRRDELLQPDSGKDLLEDLADLASPIKAFVRDFCCEGPEFEISIDDIFELWEKWCDVNGRERTGKKQIFARDLISALPNLRKKKVRGEFGREIRYVGIGERETMLRQTNTEVVSKGQRTAF